MGEERINISEHTQNFAFSGAPRILKSTSQSTSWWRKRGEVESEGKRKLVRRKIIFLKKILFKKEVEKGEGKIPQGEDERGEQEES